MRVCHWITAAGLVAAVHGATPSLRVYSTAEGLVRNDINRIFSDSGGFLWFATPEGLSRFDGTSFRNYGIQDGLPDQAINDIAETKDGLWVAGRSGLARLDPDSARKRGPLFVKFPFEVSGNPGRVFRVIADTDGRSLWCGTRYGLFRFEPAGEGAQYRTMFRPIPLNQGSEPSVWDIFRDASGSMWLATRDQGVFRLSADGSVTHIGPREGLPSTNAESVAADAGGRIWAGTDQGLCLMTPRGVERVFKIRDGLRSNLIQEMRLRRNGTLALATGEGLQFMARDSTEFSSYGAAALAQSGALGEDREGNLWVGSYRGATRLSDSDLFVTFDPSDGLMGWVKSIVEDRGGDVCAVTGESNSTGFYCRTGGVFAEVRPKGMPTKPPAIFGWQQIHMQDHLGAWWIPERHRLYRYSARDHAAQLATTDPAAIYDRRNGIPDGEIFRLFEDSRGDVWIATWHEDGLVRWRRATGVFEHFTEVKGLPSSFTEDRGGNVWIGFYQGGLARFRDGAVSRLTGFPNGGVFCLLVDHAGRLWAGTSGGGLVRIDEPAAAQVRWTAYTTRQGLSSDDISALTEDLSGRIYVVSGRGIDRLNPDTSEIRHYDTTSLNAALRDHQGRLWFASFEGLRLLMPTSETTAALPDARIDHVRVHGRAWPVSEFGETALTGMELTNADNSLQFDFLTLNLDPGRRVLYQYRLLGGDGQWTAPSPIASVSFAAVPPGSYRFEVRTVDALGLRAGVPAAVSFRILPPMWRRWWFLTAAALLTIWLATAAYNFRVNRLLEMARIRTRIATDLHDDIGSSLSQIALLSEVARRENGKGEALVRIGAVSRDLVDSMSDVVWAIDPRWDAAGDLVSRMKRFAGDLLPARGIEFRFEAQCPDANLKLDADTRRNVFLIFKESLHNVVKHSSAHSVDITLALDSNSVVLEVEDDGRGFHPDPEGTGHGLRSMRSRASELGGILDIGPGGRGGTRLLLRAALRRRATLQKQVG